MPSKEILRDILETLKKSRPAPIITLNEDGWNGENSQEYYHAVQWLAERGLVDSTQDTVLSSPCKVFTLSINSFGMEFLENGCELKSEPVTIRIDDDQFKTLLLSIAESVGDKRDVFTLRSFFNRAGAAGVSAFMAESVKLGLSNLSVILSKF